MRTGLLLIASMCSALAFAEGPTMEERSIAFLGVNAANAEGNKSGAANALLDVIDDPQWDMFDGEAYARLAVLLGGLDLPYSALVAYTKALDADPDGVGSEAGKAVGLADTVGDHAILEPVFASNFGLAVDDATRSRMAYLAARENHRKGQYATASAILKLVTSSDPYYPEAKALEGVVLSLQKRHGDALIPLQIALAVGDRSQRGDVFKNVVTMNLARAYYAAGNFPQAAHYWGRIGRDDPKWLDAQFEKAWAYFRMEDMNGTLSLLQNHVSPYFADRYYPEAAMLRLYALFLLCKFPEASTQLDAFKKQYQPQHQALSIAAAQSPAEAFNEIRLHLEGNKTTLPPTVTAAFENEDRIKDSVGAVLSAEEEIARLRNVSANAFAQTAMTWIEDRRNTLIEAEGQRVIKRISAMEAELSTLLANADVTKLDLLQMESRLYERASFTGTIPGGKRRVMRKVKAKAGERLWDWQGEYWADEVGYFRINTKPDCPENLISGEQ